MTTLSPPAARLTIEDWLDVAASNVVARRMESARFKLADLGNQGGVGLRAVYLSGPPGVGKTHSIVEQEAVWRSQGIEPLRFRPATALALLDYFATAQGKRPLIMEEADIIFRSKPMFEILKQATDPLTPDTFNRIVRVNRAKAVQRINLNVPVVVSTNMDLMNDAAWDRALLPDRDALFNRSRPIIIPDDATALWEWSIYLALRSRLTAGFAVRNPKGGAPEQLSNSLATQARAIIWFTENLNQLAVISPRTLKHVAQFMGREQRGDMPTPIMQEELDGMLGPTRTNPVPIPAQANWGDLLKTMPKL